MLRSFYRYYRALAKLAACLRCDRESTFSVVLSDLLVPSHLSNWNSSLRPLALDVAEGPHFLK